MKWAIGFLLATVVGGIVTNIFLSRLRRSIPTEQAALDRPRVTPWITGVVERTFFFLFVAFNISGVPTAMVGWIAVKLATNWNRPPGSKENEPSSRALGISGALAGVVSMTFAMLGGLVTTGQISYKPPYVGSSVANKTASEVAVIADELRIIKSLSDDGVITLEEYERMKKGLLGF